MQKVASFPTQDIPDLKEKLIRYASNFPLAAIYDSNSSQFAANRQHYINYDLIAGFSFTVDSPLTIRKFEDLGAINENNPNWYLGYITYDVKNFIEKLYSSNPDAINWPPVLFFKPDILFLQKDEIVTVYSCMNDIDLEVFNAKKSRQNSAHFSFSEPNLRPRMTKTEYLRSVSELKKEIARGNIYEINFCQEFYNTHEIDPYESFLIINAKTPSPFAAFFKFEDKFLLSASPERFLMKKQSKLISQPIKGTAPRGESALKDKQLVTQLKMDLKERTENIMIVDLVRNDLSRIAKKNTVRVKELCGVYSFPHVHQMISTISADLPPISFLDIIKATFPMGSMTGAPKLSAMKLIEVFEIVKRGLYSGTVGYISPGMDFDFNVIIRSLQYNATNHYVSYMAGGAITAMSDPEKEYDECLLKAYAINAPDKKISYAK